MQPRTANAEPSIWSVPVPDKEGRTRKVRSRLDWAILASLLAMAAFNLIAAAGQFGSTEAHAATPACGIPLA